MPPVDELLHIETEPGAQVHVVTHIEVIELTQAPHTAHLPEQPSPLPPAPVPHPRLTYRRIFMLASLALWLCVVALPAAFQYSRLQLHAIGKPSIELFTADGGAVVVPRSHFLTLSINRAVHRNAWAMTAINMPAAIPYLAISRVTTWPRPWSPRGFAAIVWPATIFPFLALPFWYFAGLGFDAAAYRTHAAWPLHLLGTLVVFASALILVAYKICPLIGDDPTDLYLLSFMALWGTLCLAHPIAWLRRLRS